MNEYLRGVLETVVYLSEVGCELRELRGEVLRLIALDFRAKLQTQGSISKI